MVLKYPKEYQRLKVKKRYPGEIGGPPGRL
jgi:hypothetical protein